MKIIFQSNRFFAVHSYSHSHGLLLLRSTKTQETPTRVDILFQDVRAMELRCWFKGITIEAVAPDFLHEFVSRPAEMIEPGNVVYALHGGNWKGFIVGGVVSTHEDVGEYGDPSALLAGE